MASILLGIETSCDETAAAVVTEDGEVLSSVVASQAELHARYGGVVPEIASRRHLELISPVVVTALDDAGATLADIGRIGVTQGPGLVGALLVGLNAAKALKNARPSTREWFATAKNYATFANTGGLYDDLLEYVKTKK